MHEEDVLILPTFIFSAGSLQDKRKI